MRQANAIASEPASTWHLAQRRRQPWPRTRARHLPDKRSSPQVAPEQQSRCRRPRARARQPRARARQQRRRQGQRGRRWGPESCGHSPASGRSQPNPTPWHRSSARPYPGTWRPWTQPGPQRPPGPERQQKWPRESGRAREPQQQPKPRRARAKTCGHSHASGQTLPNPPRPHRHSTQPQHGIRPGPEQQARRRTVRFRRSPARPQPHQPPKPRRRWAGGGGGGHCGADVAGPGQFEEVPHLLRGRVPGAAEHGTVGGSLRPSRAAGRRGFRQRAPGRRCL